MKAVRGDGYHAQGSVAENAFSVVRRLRVEPKRQANLDYLSRAAKESLDFAIEKYGWMTPEQLSVVSHDAAWDSADENDIIPLTSLALDAPNRDELLAYLRDPFADDDTDPESSKRS
jgi:hypothetical protein